MAAEAAQDRSGLRQAARLAGENRLRGTFFAPRNAVLFCKCVRAKKCVKYVLVLLYACAVRPHDD